MSTSAKLGNKSTIKWNGVKLSDVKKIGNIPLTNSEVDVTDLDSDAKEFIAGLKDYGSVPIEGNYRPDDLGQAGMETDAVSGVAREVIVFLLNLGVTVTFNAFVKSFAFGESTSEGIVPFTAELRITGAIATTAADLTALSISEGTLTPAFSATKYSYGAITTSSSFTVTSTLAGGTITVTANGVTQNAITATPVTVALTQSGVTEIVISVTKDGGRSTYRILACDMT